MTATTIRSRRILIGAGNFADAEAAFPIVERLAEGPATEIGGILIEEATLIEVAGLPRQRMVTSSGTLIVAPTPKQLRTILESDAKAFRQGLSALARSRKWTFERRRGELISGLCVAAGGWDILLLGHRTTYRQAGKVVLIAPPARAAQDAVQVAEYLAQALGTSSLTLYLGEPARRGVLAETFGREAEILARIGRMHASAVVLDLSAGPLRTYDQLRGVLSAARCPVVVLGASHGEPSIRHTTQTPPASNPGS